MAELTWAGFLSDLIATTLGAGLAVVIAWRVFKAESARMQKAEFAERERLQQAKFEETHAFNGRSLPRITDSVSSH